AFAALAESLMNGSAPRAKNLVITDGLHLMLAQAAGAPLSADNLKQAPPAVLAAVAGDAKADPGMRLAVAERLAELGAMPVETLVGLYTAEPAQPEEVDKALQAPDSGFDAHRRAVLYQAAARATHPAARAQLLQRSYELSRAQGGYCSAVAASLDLLTQVP